jgi:hypothetical protein
MMTGHPILDIPETCTLPTTLSNPPTSNLHPFELPPIEQGTQPDTTVQELPTPNPEPSYFCQILLQAFSNPLQNFLLRILTVKKRTIQWGH